VGVLGADEIVMTLPKLAGSLLTFCVAIGCSTPQGSGVPEVTEEFQQCYAEGKTIWITGIGVEENAPRDRIINTLDKDYPSEAKRRIAEIDTDAMRNGAIKTAEDLGTKWFLACAKGTRLERHTQAEVRRCFAVQRMTFEMNVMKSRGSSKQAIVDNFTADQRFATWISPAQVPRHVEKVYSVVKPGGDPAFFAAQFLLCLAGQD
jgi:hypothetical protein